MVPGIDGPFDGPAMLAAIAPRPLLVVNGDSDVNTPVARLETMLGEAGATLLLSTRPETVFSGGRVLLLNSLRSGAASNR